VQMPQVHDAHRKLEAMAGSWKGEETLSPSPWDPKGGTAVGRFISKLDLDGFALITDYVQERGGQTTYRGHGVFGWSEKDKAYTMHWFDSMGGDPSGPPALGTWAGNDLTFEHRTPMGLSRYVYHFEGDGRYTFRIDNSQDGKKWATFMEGKYMRAR